MGTVSLEMIDGRKKYITTEISPSPFFDDGFICVFPQ